MENNLESALQSSSESIRTEFKESFDISSPQEWCELIKDIVAIANTEGGVILIGVDNFGVPVNRRFSTNKIPDPQTLQIKSINILAINFQNLLYARVKKMGMILMQSLFKIFLFPLFLLNQAHMILVMASKRQLSDQELFISDMARRVNQAIQMICNMPLVRS
jgi:predicted HTH transcriptional regulator